MFKFAKREKNSARTFAIGIITLAFANQLAFAECQDAYQKAIQSEFEMMSLRE